MSSKRRVSDENEAKAAIGVHKLAYAILVIGVSSCLLPII